jgi:hypothetical protein
LFVVKPAILHSVVFAFKFALKFALKFAAAGPIQQYQQFDKGAVS